MKQLFLFLLGIFSGLCALFFVALFRFILEPDYIIRYNPGYVLRNRQANAKAAAELIHK